MAQLGCDVDEMTRLGQLFARQSDEVTGLTARVDTALLRLMWDGADAAAFHRDWRQRRAALADAALLLRASAGVVQRNRLEQLAASQAAGGPAGAGGPIAAGGGPGTGPVVGGAPPPGGWSQQAADHAGIDLSSWDPALGADANADTIRAVYRYYGQLFLDQPELQWAGMANMIGPSFAAGFFDLAALRSAAGSVAGALGEIPGPLRPVDIDAVRALASMTEEDLRYYETTFLSMQREIFLDQATMHEAYLSGGMTAIEQLRAAGTIDDATVAAWRQIDTGTRTNDAAMVTTGNLGLLHREQFDVIADDYDAMYAHSPTGPAMTYLMTLVGQPSIPGAHGYADVFPLTVSFSTPGPERIGTPDNIFGVPIPSISVDDPLQGTVTVVTPLPAGNIADRADRWSLITADTLPAYQTVLADPATARAIVGSDVGSRIEDNRLPYRIDHIIGRLTDWQIGFSQ